MMKQASISVAKNTCLFAMLFALMTLAAVGCKPTSMVQEANERFLRSIIEGPSVSAEVKQRAEAVLKQLREGSLSSEPTLIAASLSSPEGMSQMELALVFSDAAEDLEGVAIIEKVVDSNGGETVSREDYPVFAHFTLPGRVNVDLINVEIRKNGERKDQEAWANYLAMDFEEALDEAIHNGDVEVEQTAAPWPWEEPMWDARLKFWRQTLPTVWISMPKPGQTEIWAQVYDKEGHRSNLARVVWMGANLE